MTLRPINMNEYRTAAEDISLHLENDSMKKLAVYAGRENMCPEVFLRDVIAAGIRSYEVYGVI